MNDSECQKRIYDHRLRDCVRETGNVGIAKKLGVPRTTISSWLDTPRQDVISHEVFDLDDLQVRRRILKLERRLRKVTAIALLLLSLIRIFNIRLDHERLPEGKRKIKLLRVVDRAQKVLPLRLALRILQLSAARYHEWLRAEKNGCRLDDASSCPKVHSTQLTPEELSVMHEMSTSPEYRHVSTGRLAALAERMGKVFASASTWHRYIRLLDWRRPRKRIHPAKPTVGLRCISPDATWHIDTTVIRLLDGTKAYLQAIIDNFSRRILAWQLGPKLEPAATATLLVRRMSLGVRLVERAIHNPLWSMAAWRISTKPLPNWSPTV